TNCASCPSRRGCPLGSSSRRARDARVAGDASDAGQQVVGGTGSITFGGLASGIDTNSIIDQLIQIERRPIALAQNRLAQVTQRSDAFGLIASTMSNLLARVQTLAKPETFSARSTSVLAKQA